MQDSNAAPQFIPPGLPPPYNQNAIISLICMIVSWLLLPIILAIAAIIFGNKAQKEIELSNGMQSGSVLARAGIIGGWINIGVYVLGLVCFILFFVVTFGTFVVTFGTFVVIFGRAVVSIPP